jgi:UDP-N-acetylglucosamine 2-epimerase (hydrolysing)
MRRVVFLSGTRADFGKLKSLMLRLDADPRFEVHVFVTGMHMLSKYGSTYEEVEKAGFRNIYRFINQNASDSMDHILAKTVNGLSDYLKEIEPDFLVVHGDRIEAMAGAIVGVLNDILVGHIEGGEVSGTIDESIRHAVSKLSNLHFVANDEARERLLQLGERADAIQVIGSPDVDVMNSANLPTIDAVRERYGFDFQDYGILLFHPVTSELSDLRRQIGVVVDEVLESGRNYVVIYPNNDHGTDTILEAYQRLRDVPGIRIYPSMRFEYFLTLLRHARIILGNSSAGIREAPHYGVPAVNLGTRQNNRVRSDMVLDVPITAPAVKAAIDQALNMPRSPQALFGHGNSAERFHDIVGAEAFWARDKQKYFVDRAMKNATDSAA